MASAMFAISHGSCARVIDEIPSPPLHDGRPVSHASGIIVYVSAIIIVSAIRRFRKRPRRRTQFDFTSYLENLTKTYTLRDRCRSCVRLIRRLVDALTDASAHCTNPCTYDRNKARVYILSSNLTVFGSEKL